MKTWRDYQFENSRAYRRTLAGWYVLLLVLGFSVGRLVGARLESERLVCQLAALAASAAMFLLAALARSYRRDSRALPPLTYPLQERIHQ